MITAADNHLIKIAKPGENTGDWDTFEQRINEQIHIIIKGSRYVTANHMLIDIDYPFLKKVPERSRIVAIFGHALVDGEHVNERHEGITPGNLEHQPVLHQIPFDNRFVNLRNAPNFGTILTRSRGSIIEK